MSIPRVYFGLGLLVALAIAPPSARAQDDTFEWAGTLAAGQTLEVKGIAGNIRTTLASGNQAEVIARKRGDADDFHQVAIEVAEVGNRVVICAVYGTWNHGQDHCNPDRSNRGDNRDHHQNVSIDTDVDFEVRLPAGVDFRGTVVSGDITADGLRSDVSATTVEGDVSVVTTGRAWANTVSGDIELEMGDFSGGDLDFNTVSGDIVLWLPADFSADVDFNSLSGDFETDFDIDVRRRNDRWVGLQIEGTIGGGGRELSLNTISGNVELRRSRG